MIQTSPLETFRLPPSDSISPLEEYLQEVFLPTLAMLPIYTPGNGDNYIPKLEFKADDSASISADMPERKQAQDSLYQPSMLELRDQAVELLSSGVIGESNRAELMQVISGITRLPDGTRRNLELVLSFINEGLSQSGQTAFLDITTDSRYLARLNQALIASGDFFHHIPAAIVLRDLNTHEHLGDEVGIRVLRPTRDA